MPRIPFAIVHAFALSPHGGNPAAVCHVDENLTPAQMRRVAAELDVPASAFVTDASRTVTWFTPAGREIPTCGHGAIAVAHRLLSPEPGRNRLQLITGAGPIQLALRNGLPAIRMPAHAVEDSNAAALGGALEGPPPEAVFRGRDLVAVYRSPDDVAALRPDAAALEAVSAYAVAAIAPASHGAFVARYFKSDKPGLEDAANASCQAYIAPLLRRLTSGVSFEIQYLSARGGIMHVSAGPYSVEVSGPALTFAEGELQI